MSSEGNRSTGGPLNFFERLGNGVAEDDGVDAVGGLLGADLWLAFGGVLVVAQFSISISNWSAESLFWADFRWSAALWTVSTCSSVSRYVIYGLFRSFFGHNPLRHGVFFSVVGKPKVFVIEIDCIGPGFGGDAVEEL